MLVVSLNTLLVTGCIALLAIPKWLSPPGAWRNAITHALASLGELWISINTLVLGCYRALQWDVVLPEGLDHNGRYLVLCNHQSWVDILVLQHCLNRHAPFMRFMLKQQLIWVPVIGFAWWALDFPFLRRYTRAQLLKNPALRHKDLRNAARACEKLRQVPVAMMSFPEGTRFSAAKHKQQNAPYRHLLRPRYGGLGQVLYSFGAALRNAIDVTIYYPDGVPTFWQLLSGQVKRISLQARLRPIEAGLSGVDFSSDPAAKARLKLWLDGLWQEKDDRLESAVTSGSLNELGV